MKSNTPGHSKISTTEDPIATIIIASLEAQRAAVDLLEDIDLAETFASATTKARVRVWSWPQRSSTRWVCSEVERCCR